MVATGISLEDFLVLNSEVNSSQGNMIYLVNIMDIKRRLILISVVIDDDNLTVRSNHSLWSGMG